MTDDGLMMHYFTDASYKSKKKCNNNIEFVCACVNKLFKHRINSLKTL